MFLLLVQCDWKVNSGFVRHMGDAEWLKCTLFLLHRLDDESLNKSGLAAVPPLVRFLSCSSWHCKTRQQNGECVWFPCWQGVVGKWWGLLVSVCVRSRDVPDFWGQRWLSADWDTDGFGGDEEGVSFVIPPAIKKSPHLYFRESLILWIF